MENPTASLTARHRQLLLAVLVALWLVGGAYFILRLEMQEFDSSQDRAASALRLGVLLLQLLIAVSSTALLIWTRWRRTAERRERQHAEEFRQLFHEGTEAMFVATADLAIVEINAAALRLTGYTRDEILSRRIADLIAPEEHLSRPLKLAALHAGKRIESERQVVRKDGSRIDVEFSVQRLSNERVLGVCRDVSRRRATEKRLRLLSRALEESPAAMVITDPSGVIEYVNPRFSEVTGWSLEDAAGRTPAILKSGRTPVATYSALWQAIGSGKEWQGELVNQRRNGECFPWILSVHPIVDEQGKIEHFLGVGEDATERRAAEQSLAETRTALYQAQKMEALGRLAGGVAHDFNNLLGIILGCADLLAETLGAGAAGREEISELRKAVMRASELTGQLLAFSRRQVLRVRVVDLASLLEDSRRMLSRLLPESIELGLEIGPDLWSVRADSTQLVQVLVNLAVNARDAMPLGGRLAISASNAPLDAQAAEELGLAEGDYVRLIVHDTGEGMTPDVIEHAFEPFFTTKAATGGTGLGLATVYGIVQQLGGSIEIASSSARGTDLVLYLPRVDRKGSGELPVAPRAVAGAVSATVLVVEDLAPLRNLVERLLRQLGYQVVSAPTAQEALALVGEGGVAIDLVLSDIVMPGMDGRDLARLLRAARPEIRIVLMTGYSDLFLETSDAHQLSADAIIQKPFSRDQIAEVLSKVLAGSKDEQDVS